MASRRGARPEPGLAVAIYRYQVVSVGMWRGKIKRWNTTFHTSSSTDLNDIHTAMQKACYPNPGDVVGACSGGVASISRYGATGGAPQQQVVYFDWQVTSTWIPFTGEAWSGIDAGTPLDASGESAAIIVGDLGTLSRTGKPMSTRKYLHAIPSRTAAAFDDPDIPPATVTALQGVFRASLLQSPSGATPVAITVPPWYGNHQRVRGRRRTTNQVAANSFSAGVAAGAAAGSAGAASPQ